MCMFVHLAARMCGYVQAWEFAGAVGSGVAPVAVVGDVAGVGVADVAARLDVMAPLVLRLL